MEYKVTVDTREKKIVELTVSAEEVDELLPAAYELVAMDNAIPIEMAPPQESIYAALGEEIAAAAVETAVMDHFAAIVAAKESVHTLVAPVLRRHKSMAQGEEFSFEIVFLGKPMARLSSYEPVSVMLPEITVREEDIDRAIDSILDEHAEYEAIFDDACVPKPGDRLEIKMDSYNKGVPYKSLSFERRPYELGELFLPQAFEDMLQTMSVGETRELTFCVPTQLGQYEECSNLELVAIVTLLSLSRKTLPELTDEWVRAQIPDARDLQGLRAFIREDLTQGLEAQFEQAKQAACLYALTDRLEVALGDELLNSAYEAGAIDVERQLKEAGLTMEEYLAQAQMSREQHDVQIMAAVREQIRQAIALDALAAGRGITPTTEDYNKVFTMMAPGDEMGVRKEFEGTSRMLQIEEMATRMKTMEWLCDTAKVLESHQYDDMQ